MVLDAAAPRLSSGCTGHRATHTPSKPPTRTFKQASPRSASLHGLHAAAWRLEHTRVTRQLSAPGNTTDAPVRLLESPGNARAFASTSLAADWKRPDGLTDGARRQICHHAALTTRHDTVRPWDLRLHPHVQGQRGRPRRCPRWPSAGGACTLGASWSQSPRGRRR